VQWWITQENTFNRVTADYFYLDKGCLVGFLKSGVLKIAGMAVDWTHSLKSWFSQSGAFDHLGIGTPIWWCNGWKWWKGAKKEPEGLKNTHSSFAKLCLFDLYVDGTNFTKIEQRLYILSLLKIDHFQPFCSKSQCPFSFDKNLSAPHVQWYYHIRLNQIDKQAWAVKL